MSLQRRRHVFKDVEREGGRGREREVRELRECAPLVVVRFVLTYLRREVVRSANTCAGQLHSTAVTTAWYKYHTFAQVHYTCTYYLPLEHLCNTKVSQLHNSTPSKEDILKYIRPGRNISAVNSKAVYLKTDDTHYHTCDFMSLCSIFLSCTCLRARHICTNQLRTYMYSVWYIVHEWQQNKTTLKLHADYYASFKKSKKVFIIVWSSTPSTSHTHTNSMYMYIRIPGSDLLLKEESAPLIIDLLIEVSTITVVHDNVEAAPVLEGVLVGHDVWVLHLRQDLHLDKPVTMLFMHSMTVWIWYFGFLHTV